VEPYRGPRGVTHVSPLRGDLLDKEQAMPLRRVQVGLDDRLSWSAIVGYLHQQSAGQRRDADRDRTAGARLGVQDRVGDQFGDK
jgi:hypothetical protein